MIQDGTPEFNAQQDELAKQYRQGPKDQPRSSPGTVAAALDRMDALIAPGNSLLAVSDTSATAEAARADMALIRAALTPSSLTARKCSQCKKVYKHGPGSVGCPRCAPGVEIAEAEFQKTIAQEQQPAPSAAAAPVAVKAMGYGGSTGINDYLMSDGTVKAMRPAEVKWAPQPSPTPQADSAPGAVTVERAIQIAASLGVREYGPNTRNWSFDYAQLARFVAAITAPQADSQPAPATPTVTVDGLALRQVLVALVGAPHHIRELQATRSLHKLGHPNPIETLLEQFNAQAEPEGGPAA